jgi:diguanylate cyclase (GGDEF)-like protein
VVELDRFAGVHDLYGGAIADAVLVEAARRLRSGAGPDDVVARLGTDTFAVLTPASRVRAYALATRLLTMLAEPYQPPGKTVHLSADIGVADLGNGDIDPDEVLRQADLARRQARQLGRGRAECYDASLEAVHLRRTAIEQYLPGVAERGELDLVFQPVVELPDRLPVGVEALVRWRHARLGLVSPLDFLPVAEALGTVDEIVTWVLHQACRQLSVWRRDDPGLWISVNVSPRQLRGARFLAIVAAAIDTHGIPADRLIIEVDEVGPGERGLVDDPVLTDRLAGLRDLGVRTAIDHFGTGPTTLAHLRHLPVDVLKIDRAVFTEPAGRSGPASPIIDVVVTLARRLGVDVIAAGLEAESHVAVVRAAGCEYGQGFVLARPEHAEHTEAFLERRQTRLR